MLITIASDERVTEEHGIPKRDFKVTIGGETRVVEASMGGTDADGTVRYFLPHEFAAAVGRQGGKAHRTGLTLELSPEGKITVFEPVVLNRQARLVSFWQACYDAPQGYGSKHKGTFWGKLSKPVPSSLYQG